MKTFVFALLFLVSHVGAQQCTTEDEALDACMETAGTGGPAKTACDLCVSGAGETAGEAGGVCADFEGGSSELCAALAGCMRCPAECSAEMEACKPLDTLVLLSRP
jgi:hypothetical protein